MSTSYLILIQLITAVHCGNILGWFSCPAISHQKVFQLVWKELSLMGHQVTVIASDPIKNSTLKTLTEIDTHFTYKVWNEIDISNMRKELMNSFEIEYYFQKSHGITIGWAVQMKEVQEILKKPKDFFDLIIIESHHPILYGLQHKFDAPLIAISSLANFNYLHYLFGNTIHPALYGDFISGLAGRFTFLEKIDNFYQVVLSHLMYKFIIYPDADKKARMYFGEDMPYIEDVIRNTSLLFENINPIFSNNKPLTPNVMFFSMMHTAKKDVLDTDLQEILDNATEGFVYFSLGTNVKFNSIPKNMKESLMDALGALPYIVLLKGDSEHHPEKPKNVVLRKWFPQQSILEHHNIKVFVTQGGLQSSEEAIYNSVPLVVIPFLADQPLNAKILTMHGMAETISPMSLTKDKLLETILKVAKDKKYQTRAKELREIFLDQPQSGIDKVVWWCEYVMRHKGAKHLRSPGADIPLYEYFMLDILAVLLSALFAMYHVLKIVLRQLVRLVKNIWPGAKKDKKL